MKYEKRKLNMRNFEHFRKLNMKTFEHFLFHARAQVGFQMLL